MPSFLVDENLPRRLAEELSSRGLESLHVSDVPGLRSASDEEIVAHAADQGLILVTKDKEISFVKRFPDVARNGIVTVRIRDKMPIDEQVRIVVSAIASVEPGEFAGSIVVVEPGRVRLRRGAG